jgi:hypothetical protein
MPHHIYPPRNWEAAVLKSNDFTQAKSPPAPCNLDCSGNPAGFATQILRAKNAPKFRK